MWSASVVFDAMEGEHQPGAAVKRVHNPGRVVTLARCRLLVGDDGADTVAETRVAAAEDK